jgi:hypothetical protein
MGKPKPLPPVRKRQSYQDISPDDLTFALFADRIQAANNPDAPKTSRVKPKKRRTPAGRPKK